MTKHPKTMSEIRDDEAEKRNQAMLNVGEHWRVGHIAKTNFTLGFDCRDKLGDEKIEWRKQAYDRLDDVNIRLNEALRDMTESRNAYAMALKVALENSIFPNKQYVKDEIDKILTPEIRKLRGEG